MAPGSCPSLQNQLRHSQLARTCTPSHMHPQKHPCTSVHCCQEARLAGIQLIHTEPPWTLKNVYDCIGPSEGASKFTSFSPPLSPRVPVVSPVPASFCHPLRGDERNSPSQWPLLETPVSAFLRVMQSQVRAKLEKGKVAHPGSSFPFSAHMNMHTHSHMHTHAHTQTHTETHLPP